MPISGHSFQPHGRPPRPRQSPRRVLRPSQPLPRLMRAQFRLAWPGLHRSRASARMKSKRRVATEYKGASDVSPFSSRRLCLLEAASPRHDSAAPPIAGPSPDAPLLPDAASGNEFHFALASVHFGFTAYAYREAYRHLCKLNGEGACAVARALHRSVVAGPDRPAA